MSVLNCKVNYKKIPGNSRVSTINLLVAHKLIDRFFNIKDINNFRKANTELSKKASKKLGRDVRLFVEENNKVLPTNDVFKELDNLYFAETIVPIQEEQQSEPKMVDDIVSIMKPGVQQEMEFPETSEKEAIKEEIVEQKTEEQISQEALNFQEDKEDLNEIQFNRQVYTELDINTSTEILKQLAGKFADRLGVKVNFISRDQAKDLTKNASHKWNGERAFYLNDEVYFLENEFRTDDVLHEFAHPVITAIRKNNPELFAKLYQELSSTQEGQEIINGITAEYSDYNKIQIQEEAMVKFLEKAGLKELQTEKSKTFFQKLLYNIKQFFRKLFKSKIKIENLTASTTLYDLAKMLVNEEFSLPSKISEQDLVQYTRKIKEQADLLNNMKSEDVQSVVNLLYDFTASQKRKTDVNSHLKALKELSKKGSSLGGINTVKDRLRLLQDIEKTLTRQSDGFNKAEEIIKSLIELRLLSANIAEHVNEILSGKKDEIDLKTLFYYAEMLNDWESMINGLESIFNKRDDNNQVAVPLNHPLRENVNNILGDIKSINNAINSTRMVVTVDHLYDSLKDVIETQKEYYDKEIERAASEKEKEKIRKTYEELKITKENIKKHLTGETGDVNYLSAMFEQWNLNPDIIISSFGKKIKEAQVKTIDQELARHNKFSAKFLNLLEKIPGLNPKNIQEFAKNFIFLDEIAVYEYKDENGKMLDKPILKKEKVWSFFNPHKNYRADLRMKEYELEQLKEEALLSGDKTEYFKKLQEFKRFEKDYFYRQYTDAYYKPQEELTSTELGQEAYNDMINALNALGDAQSLLDKATEKIDFDDFSVQLDEAQKNYDMLFSKVDKNGNDKSKDELKKVELLLKYREQNKGFREAQTNMVAFNRAYRDEMDRLIGLNLEPGTPEFEKAFSAWEKRNTYSKIKQEYFDEKMKRIKQLKDLELKYNQKTSEKLTELWDRIMELTKPYKDKDRTIEATVMPENVLNEINNLEKEILKIQDQLKESTGLNEQESEEFSYLMNIKIKEGLTNEENARFKELSNKKKNLDPMSDIDKLLKKKLISELAELSERSVTEYYVSMFDTMLNKVDLTGLNVKEITKDYFDELLDNTELLESIFERSPEFEKWFKQNHNLKNKFTENSETGEWIKSKKWVPSFAWTVSKPKDSKWYEKTEVTDVDGNSTFLSGVPARKYTFFTVKKEFYTGYDKATGKINLKDYQDIQGNFLPKSMKDGAVDDRYINQDYEKLRVSDPKKFELLKLMTEYHLESQQKSEEGEYVDKAFQLGYDVPRYRQTKYEIVTGQSLSKTLGDKYKESTIYNWMKNIKDSLIKASDDFDEGYNFRLENQMLPMKIIGNMNEVIPVNGVSKIEQTLVSMDITRSILDYGTSVALHKSYKFIRPELKSILDILEDDSLGKVGTYTKQGLLKAFNKKDSRINRTIAVRGLYDRHLLGKNLAKDNEDINSILKIMNRASSVSGIAYLSDIPSAYKNAWAQTYQSILEGVGGEFFNLRNLMRGKKLAYQTSLIISKDIYKLGAKDLNVQLADKFGMIQERFQNKSSQSIARSATKDIFDSSILMAPRQWLGHQATLSVGFAYLDAIKVEQTINGVTTLIPLHEAYELDSEEVIQLKEGIDPEWNNGKKFKDTVTRLNTIQNRLEGSYSNMDQAEADRWIIFKWIMHMKKWFLPMFLNKFAFSVKGKGGLLAPLIGKAEPRLLAGTNEMRIGHFIDSINALSKTIKLLITSGKFYNLSKREKSNVIKTLVDLALIKIIISELLINLLLGYDPEDDERFKKMEERSSFLKIPLITRETDQDFNPVGFLQNNLINILVGTRNEADFFIPLPGFGGTEGLKSMTDLNSIASKPYLERWLSGISAFHDYITDNEQGFYKRDSKSAFIWRQENSSKELNAWLKSMGITGEFIDPVNRRRTVETYDKRTDYGILKSLGIVEDTDDDK